MVDSVTSLTRNGLRDWLIQRVSAVILGLYMLFLLGYLLAHSPLTFTDWHALFANGFMRIFTFLALLSMLFHSWVGVWTVITDYIKCSCLRLIIEVIVFLALLGYVAWGIEIVWGI